MPPAALPIYRWALLLSLMVTVPLGYVVRFRGMFPAWLNDALGSVAYEVCWILLVALLLPRVAIWRVAIGVGLSTGAIEFLQLYQPAWLQALRQTLPGRLVLGNQFSWADFPPYGWGCLAGWAGVRSLQIRLKRLHGKSRAKSG